MREREMKRHIREVKLFDLCFFLSVPLLLVAAIWVPFFLLVPAGLPYYGWVLAAAILLSLHLLKLFLIGLVLLYKAFAPLSLREQCLFEPTCSTYMILALRKYGLIFGLMKGIRRFFRCKHPNGGIDYP